MNFPLYLQDVFGYPAGIALATLLGFFFGFVLERSGFGRATILAAQFYGRDMRVLKVMFTGIATCTVGLGIFGALGWVDLGLLKIPQTYLWAQIVGGFILGMGFIMSGYCPGTAVVATSSGNLDGVVALFGIMVGSILFAFGYPLLADFYLAGNFGAITLPKLLGLSWGLVAFLVALMALGAFWGAEKVERWVAARAGAVPPASDLAIRRRLWLGLAWAGALGWALAFFPADPEVIAEKPVRWVVPAELAQAWLADARGFYLVDLRDAQSCQQKNLMGARCLADPAQENWAELQPTRTLVILDQDGEGPLPAGLSRYAGVVWRLKGGYAGFERDILDPPAAPQAPNAEALLAYQLRRALHSHFTGAQTAPPPAPVAPKNIARSIKKGGGC